MTSRYATLTREQLAVLVPELLLIGQLIDRSGMAWCLSAFGREQMTGIAIVMAGLLAFTVLKQRGDQRGRAP